MIHPEIAREGASVDVTCPRCSGDCDNCDVCDEVGTVPQGIANAAIAAGKVDEREHMPRLRTYYRGTRR